MDAIVTSLEIVPPERTPSSSFADGSRKPMSTVVLHLEGGDSKSIRVPMRAARILEGEEPALPCGKAAVLDAIHAIEGRACYATLIDMLSRRDYATQEAVDKLVSYGYRQQEIDSAIARATASRYLDDERFVTSFIDGHKARGWGRRKIEAELRRRGIDVALIDGYPDAYFSDEDDAERARALLARRSIPTANAFERLVRFLMSKGFSYGVAADAVRERLDGTSEAS